MWQLSLEATHSYWYVFMLYTCMHIARLSFPWRQSFCYSGQVAYEEEGERVFPVESFDDEVIRMASAQLVSSHASKFSEEKILRQRHQVRVVPVTKVNYEWKGKTRTFFVYGYENKVYVPDNSYPQSCCWGCSVMWTFLHPYNEDCFRWMHLLLVISNRSFL